MQVWTVTGWTNAGKDSQWIDRCSCGQLEDRLMHVWTVTLQTDGGVDF